MSSFAKFSESPIAAEGGLSKPARAAEDPYHALDDLMAAVEALCPIWPPRDTLSRSSRMLL